MQRRIFTVREANRALPRLARLLRLLQDRYRWLRTNRHRPEYLVGDYKIVNEGLVDPAYLRALLSVRAALKEVEKLGAQVKDINTGLVDFPSRLYGRDVLLCWRLGEEQVKFWHDPESGFAGRQPLPTGQAGPETEEQGN